MILECIVENDKDAIKAEQLGFNRLELVYAMSEGGLTASYGTIKRVIENVKIPVQVMLRPHGYSFEYDEFDWMSMKEDLQAFSDLDVKRDCIWLLEERENRPGSTGESDKGSTAF